MSTNTKDLRLSWACDAETRAKLNDLAHSHGKDASTTTRDAVELYLWLGPHIKGTNQAASALGIEPGQYVARLLERSNASVIESIRSAVQSLDSVAMSESETQRDSIKHKFRAVKRDQETKPRA